MAIISMTGFGAETSTKSVLEIEVSLRTINARFLEVKAHLPREYYPFESEIKRVVKRFFKRGTVDIFVSRRMVNVGQSKRLICNEEVLGDYLKNLRHLKKRYRLTGDVHVEDVFRAEGVFTLEERKMDPQKERGQLLKTIETAAKKALKTREREGKSLGVELHRILKNLKSLAVKISVEQVAAKIHKTEQLKKRLTELQNQSMDQNRTAQEIATQIEKADIQEELIRFQTHIEFCAKLLKSPDNPGKNLEFYSQELLREINTIGSKASVASISNLVVQAKTSIDQLKEQVLNIE